MGQHQSQGIMEHYQDQFAYESPASIFVSIIGKAEPSRRMAVSFSRHEALDDLIAYLNMMMDEAVVPEGAG